MLTLTILIIIDLFILYILFGTKIPVARRSIKCGYAPDNEFPRLFNGGENEH